MQGKMREWVAFFDEHDNVAVFAETLAEAQQRAYEACAEGDKVNGVYLNDEEAAWQR